MLRRLSKELKLFLLLIGLAGYLVFFVADFTHAAEPSGVDVTNLSTENFSSAPESRQDRGGTITTLTLSATQQDTSWKAYVGNITGSLVLKNSAGWSIYEWALNASGFSGHVFVSRNDSVSWGNIGCANSTVIDAEQTFLGMSSTAPDTINKTFNWTNHTAMSIPGGFSISANTCPSTATYVNGSAQIVSNTSYFQEILLYDRAEFNFVYATFINQDSWGFNNNATLNTTYDFQLIVAENSSSSIGNIYYFYAYIS